MRSSVIRYYINNNRDWGGILLRCWIHRGHPIARPWIVMRMRKLAALQRNRAVYRIYSMPPSPSPLSLLSTSPPSQSLYISRVIKVTPLKVQISPAFHLGDETGRYNTRVVIIYIYIWMYIFTAFSITDPSTSPCTLGCRERPSWMHCVLYYIWNIPFGYLFCSIVYIHDSGGRLNIKTVLSTYGDFHVKDKTAVRTSYL